MTGSYTYSDSTTFTLTHAKRLASKVRTDLMRVHRLYGGQPSVASIDKYETEITALLHAGYLKRVTYGFKKNGNYISPTLKYEASDLASNGIDDRPGKIPIGQDVSGATFYSFLSYSSKWFALSTQDQESFENGLPYQRTTADEPGVTGYFASDKTYSAGGRSMNRSVVRN